MPIYTTSLALLRPQKQEEEGDCRDKKKAKRMSYFFMRKWVGSHKLFFLLFLVPYSFLFLLQIVEGRSKAHFGVYTVEWTCSRIGIINEWVAISKSHFG